MFVYCDAECEKPTEVSGLTPHFQPRCVDQWHHGTEDHCDGQKGLGVKWHVHAGPWWLGGQRGANNEETTESDGQVIKNTEYVIHCYIYDHIMNHTYICIWFIYDCIYNRIYIYINMHTYRDDLLYHAVKTSPKTGWDYDFVVRASFGVFTGEGIQKKTGNTQRNTCIYIIIYTCYLCVHIVFIYYYVISYQLLALICTFMNIHAAYS